jgi:hypothetical protein
VTGSTQVSEFGTPFPTTLGAFDTSPNGFYDVFVAKLNPAGSALAYSTFLGGGDYDEGFGIAVDASGAAYVTGRTINQTYPTTPGAFDTTFNGSADFDDAFVTKLSPDGSALVYSTFFGGTGVDFQGTGYDNGSSIAVDASGAAYIAGLTSSLDLPTTAGAYDTAVNGKFDAFVAKFEPSGAMLAYSTYLGGGEDDYATALAVDALGQAYVTGESASGDYPTTAGAVDTSLGGERDAVVTKLSAAGDALAYSTFLGGGGRDSGTGIAVDASSAYVTGYTGSLDYPVVNGVASAVRDKEDVFATKLSSSGAGLTYSAVVGGIAGEGRMGGADAIAVDSAGASYVTGSTELLNFSLGLGAARGGSGDLDAFVAKLSPDGSSLVYATFIGGGSEDRAFDVAVHTDGVASIVGRTRSRDFPTTLGAYATMPDFLNARAFAAKLSADGTELTYSTYVGGENSSGSSNYGIAVDAAGAAYVLADTSGGHPTTPGAYDTTANGDHDLSITKLNADGSALLYSTYLGGSNADYGSDIALDTSGAVYVTGYVGSTDYPTTPGAYDTTASTTYETVVTKLNPDGGSLGYSTYLGESGSDLGHGITVDSSGLAYVTGQTSSVDFPTTPGAFDTQLDSGDVFLTKVSADGASLVFSTLLGGGGNESGYGVAVDAGGVVT